MKATITPISIIGSGTRNGTRVKQDHQHNLMAVHVAEQTQRQRQRPGQVPDQLNRKNQRGEPDDRAAEMFEIAQAVLLDPDDVGHGKDSQSYGGVGVEIGRSRVETRGSGRSGSKSG